MNDSDPRRVGGYRLLYRLGAGGMGQVYLARSDGGRFLALKVVHPGLASAPGFRERFAREIRASRAVSGDGTVPVVAADADAATPWLASAYVPGPSLAEAVHEYGPLPEPALWRLLSGLTRALDLVHTSGLVHRDLKPSNVLMSQDGPRLIDFGIARAMDDTGLTGTGLVVGSPGYMSPEQAEGAEATPAGDIFALGALIAYAATGRGRSVPEPAPKCCSGWCTRSRTWTACRRAWRPWCAAAWPSSPARVRPWRSCGRPPLHRTGEARTGSPAPSRRRSPAVRNNC
ncbi:serine/threonine-protein kinase [Streptomyces litchfieldiae]|uniref:Serine/threonine-protein kinase n=1 Tax=Streptomyces litchfieldiae TaxID=3075543 RepID=A0ABU2MTV1_9ACTN|nr:serine/threonine-protein kinase [Streptomyces sp. DSM 44938]MDT0344832.1 serine/threonine-protein kinase [Streptomyces sp. DSM 44938]